MNELEVRLLGRFEVRHGKKIVNITSRPAQSLLAYLILSAGTAHRREKLAGILWPDSLEETARENLRHTLWRLRKALPKAEYVLADDLSITLNATSDYWFDVAELGKLNDASTSGELMEELKNYHGELLPGFYDEWVLIEREHVYSIFEQHMARLISLLQDEKRWLDILDWGERWIKLGQKPEVAYRALMSAHAAKGDMSKVAVTYERCVKSLKEFGVEPSEQTRALYAKLKAGKENVETESAIPVKEKRKESSRTNLPVPITSFVGREKEVDQIIELLGKNRLVTLTGEGGVGKTRLAIESSKRVVSQFKEGVWWIDLSGLNDPALVLQAVARGLSINETPGKSVMQTLIENIRLKQLLLVLDNCEHLINACTQLAGQLLSGCESLKILATSREALDVLGEAAWRVPSLSLPDAQDDFSIKTLVESESIRLFTERATAKQLQFVLTFQNAQAVVRICHRLSGIPLAIELAAARVRMMSVNEIAQRLDSRFELLAGGNRSAPLRHQTLRAAIDWSYQLLTKPEQTLFRRLSTFAGGFALGTAETVCGFGDLKPSHVLTLLGRLVDKSLIVVVTASKDGATRYRLLETIREYALEKLIESSEEPIVRNQHADFFSQLAVDAEPKLLGAETLHWANRLDVEHDNLLTAIDWSLRSENLDFALRIVGALLQWDAWHTNEGAERSLQVVQSPLTSQPTLLRAKALHTAAMMQMFQGRFARARALLEEALSISKALGETDSYIWALANLGSIMAYEGDYQAARDYLEEARDKAGSSRIPSMCWVFAYLGDICLFQDERERAQQMYAESVARLRELNNRSFLAYPLRRLAELTLDSADYKRAASLYEESLKLNIEGGDQRAIIASLTGFAAIALALGHLVPAARLFAAVESLSRTYSASLLPIDQQTFDRNVMRLRSQLDETTFDIEWTEGSEMTMEEAIEQALQ